MPLGNNEGMNVMQWSNQKVFLHGQNVKCNTKFMRCYSGVLCHKIHWCKHGYKLTVSGIVSTFSYLGATHLLTLKHCLSQFVLHIMAKVLNKKPRNKRNRCTVRRTLFTWTWLTQTPHPLKQDAISLRFDFSFPVIYHQLTQTCLTQTQCKLKLIWLSLSSNSL